MTLDRRLQCLLWLYITTLQGVTGLSVVVSPSPIVLLVSGQTLSIMCQWSADYTGPNAAVKYRLNDGLGTIGAVFINFGTSCPSTPPYTFTCNRDTRTLGIQIPANSYSHGDRWTCEGRNNNIDSTTPPQTNTTTVDVIVGPGTVTLSPPGTTYTKTEGDTLPDITCTADCRPGCTFVWTKPDNTNFTASAVLSLGQLYRSEHGTYTCTAGNIVGESTTTVIVSVMYGPSSVGLSPPTTSYTPIEGQTLPTVTCSSDCNPVCTYSWTKDGQTQTTGSDLQLTNIQRGQTGVYRCTASNGYGSQTSSDVTVTVNYGPGTVTLSPPDTTYTRTEGDTLPDITCTADCRPDCTFVWTKPDNTNLTASAVLSLGQLGRSEHGTYKCTAGNIYGSSTISAVVNVQFGPGTVTLSPPDTTYTKTEGDALPDITCTADCRPGCAFVWTRPDNTNFTASPVLSLGQLDRPERGTYRCTARNVVRELTTVTSVTILYGPSTVSLTPSTTSYTPIEGQTLPTVTCSSDCNPVCTYSWTKDGQSHTTGSDLQLTSIQRGQTGVYRCTASNGYGSRTSSDVSVTVNYGPGTSTSISPPGTTYTRTEGDTLSDVTCTADCRPGCTFVWTKPVNTNFTASAVLSLGQLDRSEHGMYRCTAGNVVGESTTTTSVIVTVQFPPEIGSLDYNQGDADVMEHGPKTLICKVESVPSSTITWYYKNNDTKLFTATDVLESSYTLTTAGCLDTGLYTCSARNSVSNTAVAKDIRINVLCSPRLDQRVFTDRKMGLATHDNLTMNAVFLSNPEPSSFIWTFQNSSNSSFTELNDGTDNFVIHNTPFTSNLSALSVGTRMNIQEAWFGLYNVTATNSEGNGTLTFTVTATENPNPTKIFSVDCGKQMSAKVSWKDGGNSQFYRVLFSMDAFEHSKEVYPVTIAFEEGRNMYSLNVDNLVGGRLYTFKIAAYNTYGNTTSLDAVGCTIQAECSRGTDSMYVTAVALICTSVLTFLLTVGLGLFLSRNGRLPFIKGQHLKRREFQNVQLSERAMTPNEEGDERSPYEQLDTNEITKASVYSEIGSHLPGRRKDPVNDNREYESLEGRSNPNVYEDLHGTTSGDKEIYINTAIAEGGSGSRS